jgi:hypothetical protein
MADTPLRPDIEAAKAQMPKHLGSGREIKKLVEHLWEGETIERMVGGTYGKGNGLLVLTDRRVLFLIHGVMSQQTEDFPIERISSIQWSSGMLMGTITIYASGNKAEIKNVEKGAGKTLVETVRDRIANRTAPTMPPTVAPAAAGHGDVFEQIRKLGELRDAGILTDEEFVAKKTELMGRL